MGIEENPRRFEKLFSWFGRAAKLEETLRKKLSWAAIDGNAAAKRARFDVDIETPCPAFVKAKMVSSMGWKWDISCRGRRLGHGYRSPHNIIKDNIIEILNIPSNLEGEQEED